jgi:UDPglucose--hexose-1-phosphate uridylyltransferase
VTHEVRVDPFSGLRSVVAAGRADRPGALATVTPPEPVDPAGDPFAPGNEDRTPPEVARVDDGAGGWRVRVVPNRFPLVGGDDLTEPAAVARGDLFTAVPAAGAHEVVVNAPDGVQCLAQLEAGQAAAAVGMWRERVRAHRDAGAAFVHVHVNERPAGGASLPHTHAQVVALPFVPARVARERERHGAYAARTMGADLTGDLLGEEVKQRERIVAIDDEAVLLAAYAPMGAFHLQVLPRRPRPRWEEDGPEGAAMLHRALRLLAARFGAPPPLTLWVRTAPADAERFCWRMDVVPRLAAQAGLELGTGLAVSPVSPEDAAAQLRDVADGGA